MFLAHALNAYQTSLEAGIRLLQFLVVIFSERDQTTSPVWFVRLAMGPPGTPEIGRSQPTTSNGPAKLTEAVVGAVRNEPTERRFKGATLWRRTCFSTASASWHVSPAAGDGWMGRELIRAREPRRRILG
jgi:hypothetical protein